MVLALGLACTPAFAQKKKKKEEPAVTPPVPPAPKVNRDSIMPYEQVITAKAVSDQGLFAIHKIGAKYYFEIPDSLLNREILVVSQLSGSVEGLFFGGAGLTTRPQQVVRFQKQGDFLLMRSVSHNSVASEEKPIYQSVRNNNFEPVIMSFPIKALARDSASKDSTAYVIEPG
ncbi:MAG: DUF5118 domain-containing protein, partial [Bacteroidetes bacterium]